ncbi:MAG TPA: oligosaccharide flippase family protein [Caulobacter sp.]|nr:oligosaccharide flippase family protein [Caulobacter sp.]
MSIRRNLVWSAGAQVLFFGLQFGTQVVVTRLLSPYEVGVYAVALSTNGLLATLQTFGLLSLLVRETELDEALIDTAFTINAALNGLLALLVFLASFVAARVYAEPGVGSVMALIALAPLVSIFELRPSGLLQRELQFSKIAIVSASKATVASVVTILGVLAGHSYMSMAWGNLAGAVAAVVIVNVFGHRHIALRLSLARWRKVMTFGLRMVAIGGVNTLSTRLGELILGRLLGLGALGLFSRAGTLHSVLWDNIHTVFTKVVFADLAEHQRKAGSLREAYLGILANMTALLWPAFAGVAVLSGPLVHLLYGPKWADAAPLLSLLALAGVLLTCVTMTWEVFVIRDETKLQVNIEYRRAGLSLAYFTGGAMAGGVLGAAAARIIDAATAILLYRPPLARLTDTTTADVLPIYGRSLLLALAAIAPAGALMLAVHGDPAVPLWQVAISVVLGMGLWAVVLILCRHPLVQEAGRLLKRFKPG